MYPIKKIKREKVDRCNICGERTELTWDHVPPRSTGNNHRVTFNELFSGVPSDSSYTGAFQNGFRFRSICAHCNNDILGTLYDPALKDYYSAVRQYVESTITLPQIVHVSIEINKLCRAVCGHLLAALNKFEESCKLDQDLRRYVLDPTICPPKELRLLTWIHPYGYTFIARNLYVSSDDQEHPNSLFSYYSHYPVGFASCYGTNTCGLIDLFNYCSSDIDARIQIPVQLRSFYYNDGKTLRSPAWPANVEDGYHGALFALTNEAYIEDSIIGKEKS